LGPLCRLSIWKTHPHNGRNGPLWGLLLLIEKKLMHIKHKSVKPQYSSSRANLLDLFINIHCLSLCLCGTGGMLLMDDLFGEIAFGTSLNLLNNQSGKQLFEAKIHNILRDYKNTTSLIPSSHLIIVGDAADAVSVNFSARCKFSRLNAKIYHFSDCIQCTMCVIYANVSLL
jgi:hypothetical protein